MFRALARLLLSAVVCVVAAEGAARLFWRIGYNVSVRDARHILLAFYPEMRRVDGIRPTRGDGPYDVLLLGGSALHRNWGSVEQALEEQLAREGRHDVRISNLSVPGHTSRDSLLKYAAMPDARFDLVIVYDGMNEIRTNNAPPDVFRDDYGHYAWYETVNAMAPYHRTARFALPYTLRYIATLVHQRLQPERYLPPALRDDWLQYGKEARSAAALERNLNSILDIASTRGDPVMLMTVATSVPPDYSLDAFRHHRLDYDLHVSPIELWGRPEDVRATIARHNDMIHGLVASRPHLLFVDQAALVPGGKMYFNDICHLTLTGSLRFVENLVAVLRPTMTVR